MSESMDTSNPVDPREPLEPADRERFSEWFSGYPRAPEVSEEIIQHMKAAYAAALAESPDALAGKLIDAWIADKSKGSGKISWAKAIQIVAIVTKQTDEERDRLLRMGDEDGSCEMCGRSGP